MKPFEEIWDAFDSLSDDLHKLQCDTEEAIHKLDDALQALELRTINLEKDLKE